MVEHTPDKGAVSGSIPLFGTITKHIAEMGVAGFDSRASDGFGVKGSSARWFYSIQSVCFVMVIIPAWLNR